MAVTDQADMKDASGKSTETSSAQTFKPSETFLKRRRARSIAIAAILFGMVVLFYVVTLVKLGPGVMDRPM
jgi:cell division septal protein FtsQ